MNQADMDMLELASIRSQLALLDELMEASTTTAEYSKMEDKRISLVDQEAELKEKLNVTY